MSEGALTPESLAARLPYIESESVEDQARGVLRVLLAAMEKAGASDAAPTDPATCPNCGTPVASSHSPYCSDQCREVSGFVRQFRAGLRLGWLAHPDKQVALGQALWHLLGGGRPLRISLIREKEIQKVIAREGGKCQICRGPATTVDHIGTGCNRPINLRAVCAACTSVRAFGSSEVLARENAQELLQLLANRAAAPNPLRCADDADGWDWRAYLRERSANASLS